MSKQNRREFFRVSTGALAAGLCPKLPDLTSTAGSCLSDLTAIESAQMSNEGKKPLRLGLIIHIGSDPDAAMAKVRNLGLPTAQVFVSEFAPGLEQRLRQALDKHGIEATALVVGGPGKEVWDFYQGPLTIGLVPRETREARIAHLKKASDFAAE